MQIPCTMLIGKIGKRNSLVIANFVLAMHLLVIIFSQSFIDLLLSQVFCAFAFVTKATCESDMLYDALEHNEKRGGIFSKLDGRAMSIYYYLDAVSAVLADHGFRIGHSIVHGDLPCVVILSSSAVVWPGRFFVQCKRLCASRYAADMDAGNVHFLSDGLWPFGIVYDFTVVNLHNRLYYISRLLYQCGD